MKPWSPWSRDSSSWVSARVARLGSSMALDPSEAITVRLGEVGQFSRLRAACQSRRKRSGRSVSFVLVFFGDLAGDSDLVHQRVPIELFCDHGSAGRDGGGRMARCGAEPARNLAHVLVLV